MTRRFPPRPPGCKGSHLRKCECSFCHAQHYELHARARRAARMKRVGPPGQPNLHCEVSDCASLTDSRKPFCRDHILQMPYVQTLLAEASA